MINKIAFTGRETMLTKGIENGIEKGAKTIHEYIGADKIFDNVKASELGIKKDSAYTSPFLPTGIEVKSDRNLFEQISDLVNAVKAKNQPAAKTSADKLAESYALSHGTPENHINFFG
ncbi:hypothetical protein IAC76_07875 [Spirochaetes bacterium]|uniref:Uncharacterized protein n=1 Tax=Candidatus Scatousia excrementipullorum TaxID=2840936 RepID=A0A9D9DSK0_9BACT|nr:hypothetical protein [Candidatus Scatousia excrementipullorum]